MLVVTLLLPVGMIGMAIVTYMSNMGNVQNMGGGIVMDKDGQIHDKSTYESVSLLGSFFGSACLAIPAYLFVMLVLLILWFAVKQGQSP